MTPAFGRLLRADDARQGAAPVVLVSDEFWRTQLGSDPKVLTRSIQLGSTRMTVVGVLTPGFRFPPMPKTDVIVAQAIPVAAPTPRKSGWIYGIGRLRPGATLIGAQTELARLSQQLEKEFPAEDRGSRYEAVGLRDSMVGESRRSLILLLAAAGFVLLIACANVGNLLLGRALGRQHELALRVALGASRRRLVTHVLTEGLALGLAGGVAGVGVAWYAAPVLTAFVPNASSVPALEHVGVNAGVLLFALAAGVVSALLFSAIACIGLFRTERTTLLGQRSGTMAPGATRAASSLVVAEIALAVVLLAGAGLTLRSFANLLAVDPGFTSAGVLTVEFALPEGRYDAEDARRAFYARAFADLAALPGVETVGAAMVTPLTGNNWTTPLQRVDRPTPAGQRPPEVGWQMASRGYFRALRFRCAQDGCSSPPMPPDRPSSWSARPWPIASSLANRRWAITSAWATWKPRSSVSSATSGADRWPMTRERTCTSRLSGRQRRPSRSSFARAAIRWRRCRPCDRQSAGSSRRRCSTRRTRSRTSPRNLRPRHAWRPGCSPASR